MITILVVAPAGSEIDRLSVLSPSVEVLRAHDAEEAVERLGRNRRVDAVLLLCGRHDEEVLREIREENPAPPPIFLYPGPEGVPPGGRALDPAGPEALLEMVRAAIE